VFHPALGLIRSLCQTFKDKWPELSPLPKVTIDMIMTDATSHKVKVPAAIPSWLQRIKTKLRPRTSRQIAAETRAPDAAKTRAQRTTGQKRAKQSTTSHTWEVCVTRRSLSWLSPNSKLLNIPLVVPPTPMHSTTAEYLFEALFKTGFSGQLSECIDELLAQAEIPVKLRSMESAKANRKLVAYECPTQT
jgi:hypothetical protein